MEVNSNTSQIPFVTDATIYIKDSPQYTSLTTSDYSNFFYNTTLFFSITSTADHLLQAFPPTKTKAYSQTEDTSPIEDDYHTWTTTSDEITMCVCENGDVMNVIQTRSSIDTNNGAMTTTPIRTSDVIASKSEAREENNNDGIERDVFTTPYELHEKMDDSTMSADESHSSSKTIDLKEMPSETNSQIMEDTVETAEISVSQKTTNIESNTKDAFGGPSAHTTTFPIGNRESYETLTGCPESTSEKELNTMGQEDVSPSGPPSDNSTEYESIGTKNSTSRWGDVYGSYTTNVAEVTTTTISYVAANTTVNIHATTTASKIQEKKKNEYNVNIPNSVEDIYSEGHNLTWKKMLLLMTFIIAIAQF